MLSDVIEIRAAGPDDLDGVFTLLQGFATTFRPEREHFEHMFPKIVSGDDSLLLVAEDGSSSEGYILAFDHPAFYANARVCWIEELMVAEHRRGEGIGRALVAAVEHWATDRGAALVALATRRAASFYELAGYEDSAVFFRKLLMPPGAARSASRRRT